MRILTFNVQNLRLRGTGAARHLSGARDDDTPGDQGAAAATLDAADRRLTAAIIHAAAADVVALQEVFDQASLDHFHDVQLVPTGVAPYPHRICLPGNDGRGLDVALMSRRPVDRVRSHATLTNGEIGLDGPAGAPVFRRDCLMAVIGKLTLWVCHFKAPYPDPVAAWPVRRREALAVRHLVGAAATGPDDYWLVIGDLNEPGDPAPASAPLTEGFAVDLFARLPAADRWTYRDPGSGRYARPDVMLASPALARDWPAACPELLREGLGREVARHAGPRLAAVGRHRPHASDHAAVAIDFRGL